MSTAVDPGVEAARAAVVTLLRTKGYTKHQVVGKIEDNAVIVRILDPNISITDVSLIVATVNTNGVAVGVKVGEAPQRYGGIVQVEPEPEEDPVASANYLVYAKQKGGGCDYMISCGEILDTLEAETEEEAVKEVQAWIEQHSGPDNFERVLLIPMIPTAAIKTINLQMLTVAAEQAAKEEADRKAKDKRRADYEKLKSEFEADDRRWDNFKLGDMKG